MFSSVLSVISWASRTFSWKILAGLLIAGYIVWTNWQLEKAQTQVQMLQNQVRMSHELEKHAVELQEKIRDLEKQKQQVKVVYKTIKEKPENKSYLDVSVPNDINSLLNSARTGVTKRIKSDTGATP